MVRVHAIYREAIATLIYYGAVSYGPLAYSERSPFYNERGSTVCGDYDLDTANSLLDSAGLDERNDEGNRLWRGNRSSSRRPSAHMANVPEDDPESCVHCGDTGRPEIWFRDE